MKFEIKKVFSKTLNKVLFLIMTVLVVLMSLQCVNDARYVDESGNTIKGIVAARNLKEEKNKWKGYITEDVLSKIIATEHEIVSSADYNSDDVTKQEIAYSKMQSYDDIRHIINENYSGWDDYDYYKIDNMSSSDVSGFYNRRIELLKSYFAEEPNMSDEEQDYYLEKYETINTPLYYEYCDGWKSIIADNYMVPILLIITVATGIILCGVYAEDFRYNSAAIYFSTAYGREKGTKGKLQAVIAVATAIYAFEILLYTLIVLGGLGFSGGGCPIQLYKWKSYYDITLAQGYLLSVIGGYIGLIFIVLLAAFLSAKTKNILVGAIVPFVITCLFPFIGRIPVLIPIFQHFPHMILQVSQLFKYLIVYNVSGHLVGIIELLFITYFVLSVFLIPINMRVFKKIKVYE